MSLEQSGQWQQTEDISPTSASRLAPGVHNSNRNALPDSFFTNFPQTREARVFQERVVDETHDIASNPVFV